MGIVNTAVLTMTAVTHARVQTDTRLIPTDMTAMVSQRQSCSIQLTVFNHPVYLMRQTMMSVP